MATSALEQPLRAIGDLVSQSSGTDRQLLERFNRHGDQHAFGALVHRHRDLVWGVCRRVLRHHQDAEDAFQATFLVLARKADAVRWQSSIAGWLYRVAFQTSQHAQRLRQRKRQREQPLSAEVPVSPEEENAARDVVRDELRALPDKYRLPLYLCHVEALSCKEAAERLGWSEGSVRGRLHRGKSLFRKRMLRRGIKTAAVAVALRLLQCVPAVASSLKSDTLRAVSDLIAGGGATVVANSQPVILMKGVVQTMSMSNLKKGLCLYLLAVVFGAFAIYAIAAQESSPSIKPKTASVQSTVAVGGGVQKAKWQDLFASIDVKKNRVGPGVWRLKNSKLYGYPAAHGGRLRIPVVPNGDYELRVKWQPRNGDSCVHFIVPHGDRHASIELLPYMRCAGLGDLNGVRPNINETRTDLNIKSGQIYTVLVRMKYTDKQIYVTAMLDDKKLVDWEGDRSEVDHSHFAPPKPASLGVAVSGDSSTFHSMELRMLSGKAVPWKGKASPPAASRDT